MQPHPKPTNHREQKSYDEKRAARANRWMRRQRLEKAKRREWEQTLH